MKIIVILRVAADSISPVRIEQGRVMPDSLRPVLNPFDEAALAKAVALRVKDADREVIAILIAPAGHDTLLQRMFALGAQRVIHLYSAQTVQEPIEQARQLAPVLRQEQSNLILIGREVLGDDCGDTGAMISALLDCSLATDALDLSLSADEVLVIRETMGGSEELALHLPALVTAELALANPRYITLMELAAARKKQVERMESVECAAAALSSLSLNPVAPRQRGILLASVTELATRIHAEIGTLP